MIGIGIQAVPPVVAKVEGAMQQLQAEIPGVKGFWHSIEYGHYEVGDTIQIQGSLTEYGPMVFGHPRKIKARHFALREAMSDKETSGELDGLISLSSGNALIRKPIVKGPEERDWKYAGLYEGIGRNAVPLLIDGEVFTTWKTERRAEDQKREREHHVWDVSITGILQDGADEWKRLMSTFGLPDDHVYTVYVPPDGTIEYIGEPRFFEADIWAVFQVDGENRWVSRCPDFTIPSEIANDIAAIVKTGESFGDDATLIAQYDSVANSIPQRLRMQPDPLEQRLDRRGVTTEYVNKIRELLDDP